MGERERANRRFGCELNGYRDAECQMPSMLGELGVRACGSC